MALKKVWTDNSSISVSAGELYRLSCDIRIDSGQIMDVIKRIYPSATGLSYSDLEFVQPASKNSAKETVINVKANYRPNASGTINADLAVETNQLEDNVVIYVDNYNVEGPICLDQFPSNRFNFLRWQQGQNIFLPINETIDVCGGERVEGIQRPVQKTECKPYTPTYIQGEEYSFLTNFDEDLNFPNAENPKIGIIEIDGANPIESFDCNVLNLTAKDLFHGSFTLGEIDNGFYKFVIFEPSTNQIFLISNEIYVNSRADKKRTALIKYRNSDDIDGFAYNDLPDFYNQIRIDLYQGDARNYEPEVEEENQVVTAEKRYISIANRLGIPVVSEFLDSEAQDGLESFLAHDEIYVNGKRYNARAEDLSYEQLDQAYNFYRANYVLFDYSYARNNRYK